MINRTSLRIKVLQAVYAYLESGEDVTENGVKYLLESIDKMRDLFIWQLSFIIETKRFAENRIEENKHKNIPTFEDLNPNMRYVQNRVIIALENNKDTVSADIFKNIQIFFGKIKLLDKKWNVQSSNFINRSTYTNHPKAIHMLNKPWKFASACIHKGEYFKYLQI